MASFIRLSESREREFQKNGSEAPAGTNGRMVTNFDRMCAVNDVRKEQRFFRDIKVQFFLSVQHLGSCGCL